MNKKIHINLPLIYGVNNENIYVISKNKKWKAELVVEWVTYNTRRINVSKMLDAVGISRDNFIKMLLINPKLLLPVGSKNEYNIIYGSYHTTVILKNTDGGYASDIILECSRRDVTLRDVLLNLTRWLEKSFEISVFMIRSEAKILPDGNLTITTEDIKQTIVTTIDTIPIKGKNIVSDKIQLSKLQNLIRTKNA